MAHSALAEDPRGNLYRMSSGNAPAIHQANWITWARMLPLISVTGITGPLQFRPRLFQELQRHQNDWSDLIEPV